MMMITPLYGAILALVFITLSIRTIILRGRHEVALGHGNAEELLRAIRVHGNFAEYVPLALLLIWMLESIGGSIWLIHGLAILLLTGRLIHAYGVMQTDENLKFRVVGMVMTFTTLLIAAAGILLTILI